MLQVRLVQTPHKHVLLLWRNGQKNKFQFFIITITTSSVTVNALREGDKKRWVSRTVRTHRYLQHHPFGFRALPLDDPRRVNIQSLSCPRWDMWSRAPVCCWLCVMQAGCCNQHSRRLLIGALKRLILTSQVSGKLVVTNEPLGLGAWVWRPRKMTTRLSSHYHRHQPLVCWQSAEIACSNKIDVQYNNLF